MTIHLIKLCVGVDDLDDLRDWHERRRKSADRRGEPFVLRHVTRSTPRRADEILDGGSLYWVIKGQIQARQPIVALEPTEREDGKPACAIIMAPQLSETEWRAPRAFQGWRYLAPRDAPRDLASNRQSGDKLPAEMARELRELGLL